MQAALVFLLMQKDHLKFKILEESKVLQWCTRNIKNIVFLVYIFWKAWPKNQNISLQTHHQVQSVGFCCPQWWEHILQDLNPSVNIKKQTVDPLVLMCATHDLRGSGPSAASGERFMVTKSLLCRSSHPDRLFSIWGDRWGYSIFAAWLSFNVCQLEQTSLHCKDDTVI